MPHHLNGIISLLDKAQDNGDYSCSFGTYLYTGPFNAPCRTLESSKTECKTNNNNNFVLNFVSKYDLEVHPVSLRKLSALNETYDWEV